MQIVKNPIVIDDSNDSSLVDKDMLWVLTSRCTENTSSKLNNNDHSAIITTSAFILDNDITSYSCDSNEKCLFNNNNHIVSQIIEELMSTCDKTTSSIIKSAQLCSKFNDVDNNKNANGNASSGDIDASSSPPRASHIMKNDFSIEINNENSVANPVPNNDISKNLN